MGKKLLAIGGAYLDINSSGVPFGATGIVTEQELISDNYTIEPGGSAVNFARLGVNLGLETVCLGKIGQDLPGELLTHLVQTSGVGASFITSPYVTTNLGLNFVNPAGRSIMIAVGSANQSLQPQEVIQHAKQLLPALKYLYLGSCFKLQSLLPAFEELARSAKAAGVKIVLDHGRLTQKTSDKDKAIVKQLAQQADYYFPSQNEFLKLWEVESIENGLKKLQPHSSGITVVKDGENGVVTLVGSDVLRMPAIKVRPMHTIGAGDSFNAGFIAAQEQGLDLTASLRFGSATAALKISQTESPTLEQVKALLADKAK